ncbi:MAG TPA: alpha/beta hydrolase [Kribbella sp.]|uniref:alpha/beta fold hydrolase n=1 Tax=Kribbella sp. TaxID=1871183 RepID=UPI002D76C543|nr:alpha/beta hydrolase [Kribbella sp.]HET6299787.1 alpha/beta hydrolase [Kribbella sp.]
MSSAPTHNTAPTQFVEVDGVRFAYRRFGNPAGTPIVLLQHFMGNLDNYDPAITDALALGREVILTDNAGVGLSTGKAPESVAEMARDAASLIDALGLEQVDLFGFSMGGYVAQQLTVDRPDLVRRLILVGTGPRGGDGMGQLNPDVAPLFGKVYDPQDLMWLPIFFTPSESSQAAGRRFLERVRARTEDRDLPVSEATVNAHLVAARAWGTAERGSFDYLKEIPQPALVVNGSNDIVVATVNSYILQQNLPNAELILFPDSNHGSHFQYYESFIEYVTNFIDR